MATYRRQYVWQWPVRFWHWTHFGTLLVLVATGSYIANPFLVPGVSATVTGAAPESALGLMQAARLVHFIAAIALTSAVIVRLYWFFAGNKYSSWRAWLPYFGRGQFTRAVRQIGDSLRYELLLRRTSPYGLSHNPFAALSYLAVLALLILQVLTGWALYAEGNPTSLFRPLFSWMFSIGTDQTLRLVHHLTMWLLLAFFAVHLYLAIRDDMLDYRGTMTSMFSGYKLDKEEAPEQE